MEKKEWADRILEKAAQRETLPLPGDLFDRVENEISAGPKGRTVPMYYVRWAAACFIVLLVCNGLAAVWWNNHTQQPKTFLQGYSLSSLDLSGY